MIHYEELHHVGINVTDLEKAKHFYGTILCLQEIARPDFDFEGAWYAIGQQQLHLLVRGVNSCLICWTKLDNSVLIALFSFAIYSVPSKWNKGMS